jgi:hypothetical protein
MSSHSPCVPSITSTRPNKEVLENDKMRIRCFERTGMRMTLDGLDDDTIQPQGLTIPVVVPEGADLTHDDHDDDFENDSQCEWDDDVDDTI